jgi:hypothetical protein
MEWKGPAPTLQILNDEEWKALMRLSGLPDAARAEVDGLMSFYRKYRMHELAPSPAKIQRALKRIAKEASAMLRSIDEIKQSDGLYSAFAGLTDKHILSVAGRGQVFVRVNKKGRQHGDCQIFDQELSSLGDALRRFHDRLDDARAGLAPRKRGPQREAMGILVEQLNVMLIEQTGRPISRAKTNRSGYGPAEFVIKVCQLAEQGLDQGEDSDERTVLNEIEKMALNKIKAVVTEMEEYWDPKYKPWIRQRIENDKS